MVHQLGRFAASYASLPNPHFELFLPLLGWAAAVLALRRLTSGRDELPSIAAFASLPLYATNRGERPLEAPVT